MKIILKSDEQWGFYINPASFQIFAIKEVVPEKSFVLIKNREFLQEINRTIIRNTYGIVKNEKLEKMDKKDISELISEACAKYILKHHDLPPSCKVSSDLRYTKPAVLALYVGNYDVFHLKITVDYLNGKNPKEVLDPIIAKGPKSIFIAKKEERWKVEYAKSGQAECRKCETKIEKNAVRLGEPSYYQEHLTFKWFHENCIDWTKFKIDQIAGLEVLKDSDKSRIQKKLAKQ
ncbi:MAG: hypothetical protein KGD64_05570 [Candidatus Heimdallarchaeota archaeon]|nr:hypothetical protein [Candidatus Heimdallarchaeota archaeon]